MVLSGFVQNLSIQLNPDNSNHQGKSKKTQVIMRFQLSASRIELVRKINDLEGNQKRFELHVMESLSYFRGFKLLGCNCSCVLFFISDVF